ncbi:MAG: hypothetical protein EOM73_13165, partial [Bacteroidia bacterium]|nr:hypothetical protein [Bacteroidia bacterium]
VIKRPMDLSTLRSNLMAGEYIYVHQFLKEADLMWSNCRFYNSSQADTYFIKAADECEKEFNKKMTQIEGLGLNLE